MIYYQTSLNTIMDKPRHNDIKILLQLSFFKLTTYLSEMNMERYKKVEYRYYYFCDVNVYPFWILFLYYISKIESTFYVGKTDHSINEMTRLNGRMTPREAVLKCELDDECAGFTYHGPKTILDDHVFQTTFYYYIPAIHQMNGNMMDWTTYLTENPMKTYRGKIPNGPINQFTEFHAGDFTPGVKANNYCFHTLRNKCSGIAFSNDGKMRIYTFLDLTSFTVDSSWTTFFNSRAPDANVHSVRSLDDIDRCCPRFDYHYIDPVKLNAEIQKEGRKTVKRISCEMAEKEFIEKYIRTMTPVLIQGCDFEWLNTVDLNLPSATKIFFDNTTDFVPPKDTTRIPPTFTHTFTPNDPDDPYAPDRISDSDVFLELEFGVLRQFQRLRNNEVCEARGGDCKNLMDLFAKNLQKPGPIPKDIFKTVGYENNLNWMIMSSQGTGSHPHNDPDLTGAWAFLLNGFKWWIIFPQDGVKMDDVICDESCSQDFLNDEQETWRWVQHVLPQLRNKQMYGQTLIEFVQGPGEVIFLPHGLTHAVLNVHDNVAYTENFFYVSALPELTKAVALDEISSFRPKWNQSRALDFLYYSGIASAKDRQLMRETYKQVVEQISNYPEECQRLNLERYERLEQRRNRTEGRY